MTTTLLRLVLATALVISVAPRAAAGAGAPLTRTQFVEGYVRCNNAAWAGTSRGLINHGNTPSMSDRMRGLDSPLVRGFVGEALYFDGIYGNFQPRVTATVGWALATKAFADRGDIEPSFRTRRAALAYLRPWNLDGLDTLGLHEVGALATELELSSRGARYAITRIGPGAHLGDPLDAPSALAMLAKVGTHFDVGSVRTIPQAGRPCPAKVLGGLFR